MKQSDWVGQTLNGRYKIEELLGQGGMSSVYKAYDPNLRRQVAIKIVHSHLSNDPSFIKRFEEEAAAIASLRHPNIVQVYDFNTDEDINYMVMEFVPGETLQARLKRLNKNQKKMSIAEAVNITTKINDGLSYAHERGMAHRDVKPANIMLDAKNQPVLMDFGIVKIIGSAGQTLTGAVIGTAHYMAPEVIRSETADQRSDIYSLGITLFEMLSGSPPYESDSAMTVMMMQMNDPLPNLKDKRGDIPDGLMVVLEKMTAKDRNLRYQSSEELAADLKKFSNQLPTLEYKKTDHLSEILDQKESSTPTQIVSQNEMDDSNATVMDVPQLSGGFRDAPVTKIDQNWRDSQPQTIQPKTKKNPSLIIAIVGLLGVFVVVALGLITSWFGLAAKPKAESPTLAAFAQLTEVFPLVVEPTITALVSINPTKPVMAGDPEPTAVVKQKKLLICQVTDTGGIDDKSFNATAWQGMGRAQKDLGVGIQYLESQQQSDYEININTFIEADCDLIIPVGFLIADATSAAADANPDQKFAIVDVDYLTQPNILGNSSKIDQATFLAGYVAAGMTKTGKVGTYVGILFPATQAFLDGYAMGVAKYNDVHGTNVQVLGWDMTSQKGLEVGNFESLDDGRSMGEQLLDEGADIIMPVAGPVGLGTLAVLQERGSGLLIGVDNDWSLANPDRADLILGSAMKKIDTFVYEAIQEVNDSTFKGGFPYVLSLENKGVGFIYGSSWTEKIPNNLKFEVEELIPKIISGEIPTLPTR